MSEQLSAIGLAAAVTLVVGLVGVGVIAVLARRSVGRAAVAAPVVVVIAVAAGVYASSRAMFLQPEDSRTVLLVLLVAVPVAAVLGGLVARRVMVADRAASADRMTREQEARAEADRRELVAWVSHDLRTPLAGIWAISEAVEDGVANDVPAAMRQVRDSVGQMGDLVETLLALSRLQAADPGLEMSEVDLGDLVSDAVAGVRPLADAAGVELTGSAEAGVRAEVSPSEVRRAVENLVANGIRHTPRGGRVTTVVGRGDGGAVVTVEDQCGGIPEEVLARVFETGYRGNAARSPGEGRGAGLGLAIVAGVARAHHGSASVANVPGGCRFTLRLPALATASRG
jgi:signal transduction histidine kinase